MKSEKNTLAIFEGTKHLLSNHFVLGSQQAFWAATAAAAWQGYLVFQNVQSFVMSSSEPQLVILLLCLTNPCTMRRMLLSHRNHASFLFAHFSTLLCGVLLIRCSTRRMHRTCGNK